MQKQKKQIWKPGPKHLKHSDIQESSLRPERFKGHVLMDSDGSRFLGRSCALQLVQTKEIWTGVFVSSTFNVRKRFHVTVIADWNPWKSGRRFPATRSLRSLETWDARALCSPWAERPDCQPPESPTVTPNTYGFRLPFPPIVPRSHLSLKLQTWNCQGKGGKDFKRTAGTTTTSWHSQIAAPRVLYIIYIIYGVLEGFRSKSSKCSTRLLWPCHLVKPPYATGHNRHFQKLPVEFVDSKEILLLESTSNAGYKNITAFLTRLFEIVNPGTLRIHTFQAPSPSRGCTIELRWSWEFASKNNPFPRRSSVHWTSLDMEIWWCCDAHLVLRAWM